MTLCIAFFQAVATLSNPLPAEVEKTLKSRMSYQFQVQHPNLSLEFDDPQCRWKGVYTYTASTVILNADNEMWAGSLETSFTDLMEGRKISFVGISPVKKFFSTSVSTDSRWQAPSGPTIKTVIVSGTLLAAITYALVQALGSSTSKAKSTKPAAAPINLKEKTSY
jgi:hypothetical protein